MSVPTRYKTTEAGVIPEDWDAVPLGSMFTFKNGLNKAKQFFGHGTPIVNYMDVFRYPALRMTKVAGRVEVNKSELDSYSVRQGDVFFTRTSETVEEVGIASTMLDVAESTVFSGFVLRARPKGDDLVDQFKAYAFRSQAVRNQIVAKATYTTRALTNGGTLSAIYLAKPSKPEQTAIAEALSDMDQAIAAQEAMIAKKRALKTATMQALLSGTQRLPKFSAKWSISCVGNLATCLRGVSYKGGADLRARPQPDTRTLLRANNIFNSKLNFDDVQYVVAQRVKDDQLLMPGDILICMANGSKSLVGKSALIADLYENTTFGAFMGCVRPHREADGAFLSFLFQTFLFRSQISDILSGSTINNLAPRQVEGLKFMIPDEEERIEISNVLRIIDEELDALVATHSKLSAIRHGMMQTLLTGKVRLV